MTRKLGVLVVIALASVVEWEYGRHRKISRNPGRSASKC